MEKSEEPPADSVAARDLIRSHTLRGWVDEIYASFAPLKLHPEESPNDRLAKRCANSAIFGSFLGLVLSTVSYAATERKGISQFGRGVAMVVPLFATYAVVGTFFGEMSNRPWWLPEKDQYVYMQERYWRATDYYPDRDWFVYKKQNGLTGFYELFYGREDSWFPIHQEST
eukprot:Rmarinus@m.15130